MRPEQFSYRNMKKQYPSGSQSMLIVWKPIITVAFLANRNPISHDPSRTQKIAQVEQFNKVGKWRWKERWSKNTLRFSCNKQIGNSLFVLLYIWYIQLIYRNPDDRENPSLTCQQIEEKKMKFFLLKIIAKFISLFFILTVASVCPQWTCKQFKFCFNYFELKFTRKPFLFELSLLLPLRVFLLTIALEYAICWRISNWIYNTKSNHSEIVF